jgi:signal transduction histidine kinase
MLLGFGHCGGGARVEMGVGSRIDPLLSVANVPPRKRHRLVILAVATVLIAASMIAAPFANTQMPELVAFVPTIEAVIIVNDLITAILLFAQYSVIPSRAILVLACGYVYTALIVVPHILTYPGAFAPGGLLGAGLQSTAWLYIFWHFGPPVAILGYACLKDAKGPSTAKSPQLVIVGAVASVAFLVCGLTLIATAGENFLPAIFADNLHIYKRPVLYIYCAVVLFTLISMVALWLRKRSILDYWILLVVTASIAEDTLTAALVSARYSFGFYAGRVLLLMTSMFVLILLLAEIIRLYTSLARSAQLLKRERDNKLMNLEAMMAAIIHEIKQPLTAISANAGAAMALIAKIPPNLHEAQASLEDVIDDSHRTSQVLNGVRSLFRRIDKDRQPIDLNELLLEVLKSMRADFHDHGVLVRPELAADIPLVDGDRGQLQQVALNLVHNALEAMGIATAPFRVLRLTTQRHGHEAIMVSFHDSGTGINPKQIDEIFDPFVTTKPDGMGLGLAICRSIIENHGGKLSARSDGKSGAVFQFVLPARLVGAPDYESNLGTRLPPISNTASAGI